jgi:hypothetical protein
MNKSTLNKIAINTFWKIKSVRWNVQTFVENAASWFINRHKIVPYGYCPVQAEGKLKTGEAYYYRSRHSSWSVRIAKSDALLWEGGAWVYTESKYDGFDGGCVGKLEVVRNFNKAIKMYYEHSRSRGNSTEISQHGVSGQTQTNEGKDCNTCC